MRKHVLFIALLVITTNAMAQKREVKLPEPPKNDSYVDYKMKSTGLWLAVDAECANAFMPSRKNMPYSDITLTGGYRFSEFLRLGIGFGGRVFVYNSELRGEDAELGMPVFFNARGNFIGAYNRDLIPYWSVNMGAIIRDGLYVSPSAGFSTGGVRSTFKIGLAFTLATFTDLNHKTSIYNAVGLRLGYEF